MEDFSMLSKLLISYFLPGFQIWDWFGVGDTEEKGSWVCGWGYGGEGKLGLGSRIKMVSSPHLIPFTDQPASGKHRSSLGHHGSTNLPSLVSQFPGSYVKEIACGGRHSAVVTDNQKGIASQLWSRFRQPAGSKLVVCDGIVFFNVDTRGSANDQLRPTSILSLS
ncbi:REGULATOR OF CHROMOSOME CONDENSATION [Salix koriyanagi]|uniref:REGULATOR OF CHROMOSOME CONDENSATION n=1 Tax=Salix koriyanagi TaxID=2511006 RepID=A0A9Q1ANU1_9ROSI|nr:REGULATOR OF CHROMOSOME CONDENSATION [Salix koriyanagi]